MDNFLQVTLDCEDPKSSNNTEKKSPKKKEKKTEKKNDEQKNFNTSEENSFQNYEKLKALKKPKRRKYNDSYLDYGFTSTVINDVVKPLCLFCQKPLANESMHPSKLKRHMECKHSEYIGKPRDFFVNTLIAFRRKEGISQKEAKARPNKGLLASYKVAYRIAKCRKSHIIAEELILPAAIDLVSIMIGEEEAKLLSKVPLSKDTIGRRIQHMGENLNTQLIEKLRGKEFSLLIDDSRESEKDARFICYVRFIDEELIVEDLFFCVNITLTSSSHELFEVLDKYIDGNGLDWTSCVGVCTDLGSTIAGSYGELQSLIHVKSPNVVWTYCIIHKEALVSRYISPPLDMILEIIINIMNYVKNRQQKAKFFKKFTDDLGDESKAVLYYCHSRWLSCKNILKQIFQSQQEIYAFLEEEKQSEYSKHFLDADFLIKLAYLSDLFEKLSELNITLNDRKMNIVNQQEKISAFVKKIHLWIQKFNQEYINDCFPTLHQFVTSNQLNLFPIYYNIKYIFIEHLSELIKNFEKYFEVGVDKFAWIQNPFTEKATLDFTSAEQESLIDLSCDVNLRIRFGLTDLTDFWLSLQQKYPSIIRKAFRTLIPFASSFLCETGFAALAEIKNKYRSKLNVEQDMRVAISNYVPTFEKLCTESAT
uniref:Zinc finger BED domain-containing protein 5 n=1 Tax=Sarcoptes scabiei TaxID=52283 RepID=A0A834RDR4_SARSC